MYRLVYYPTRFILRQIFKPVLKVYYHPHSKFPSGPIIFAANHPSTLDPVQLITHLPIPVSTLITSSVFSIPVIGQIAKLANHVSVDSSQGHLAYQVALKKLNQGRSILIFPEGHLSPEDGTLRPLYSGVVRLAIETGTPIIPIGIKLKNGRFFKKNFILNHKPETGRFFFKGDCYIKLGRPIYLSGPINPASLLYHKTSLSNCIYQLSQNA